MSEFKRDYYQTFTGDLIPPASHGLMNGAAPFVDLNLRHKAANIWDDFRTNRFRHALEVRYDSREQELGGSYRTLLKKAIFSFYLDMVEHGQGELARDLLYLYRLN